MPPMNEKVILRSEQDTINFGKSFAKKIKIGDLLCLYGNLGAGKTTFVRGVIEGLGGDPEQVSSPTFTLVHEYSGALVDVNHCDFYRLEEPSELVEFGGLEFFDSEKITIIEWPEKLKILNLISPKMLVRLNFEIIEQGRSIQVLE